MAGVLTGIGGGMLRDVLTKNIPFVLRKYVYALASIAGILTFCLLKHFIDSLAISSVAGVLTIVIIRLLASKFRWSLPKIHVPKDE